MGTAVAISKASSPAPTPCFHHKQCQRLTVELTNTWSPFRLRPWVMPSSSSSSQKHCINTLYTLSSINRINLPAFRASLRLYARHRLGTSPERDAPQHTIAHTAGTEGEGCQLPRALLGQREGWAASGVTGRASDKGQTCFPLRLSEAHLRLPR